VLSHENFLIRLRILVLLGVLRGLSMSNKNGARLLLSEILTRWTLLDSEAVEKSNCEPAQLTALLMTHYGFSRRRAAQEIDRALAEVDQRIKLAA
jgi:hypothetical protein